MRILGIDPGFANVGVAVVEVTNGFFHVESLDLIETKKSDLPARYDTLRRAEEISNALRPLVRGAEVIVIEAMSYPRNSVAAANIALCFGVIASLKAEGNNSLFLYTPKAAKKAVCGDLLADKGVVEEAVKCYFGDIDRAWVRKLPKWKRNHAYDALAMILAGIKERKWKLPLT